MSENRDGLQCSPICNGERYTYSVREDGAVIKCSRKRAIETFAKPFLKKGCAVVKINHREYSLKQLVAQHFMKDYRKGDCIETIDGDPFNCCIENLRAYTKRESGKRTGHRSRSHGVIVDGVDYRSVREAARALHVSYQTVLDYLGGSVKRSVLQGMNIERVE